MPESGSVRYLAILMLYLAVVGVSLGAASMLGNLTQENLCALYSEDAVFLSIGRIDEDILRQISRIALADSEVMSKLEVDRHGRNIKFINYVLPSEWNIPEIPLNPIEAPRGHYTPEDYNKNLYKIAFTKAEFPESNQNAEGKDILSKVFRRVPVAEVWVDLSSGRVVEVKNPPESVMYEGIPVPIY